MQRGGGVEAVLLEREFVEFLRSKASSSYTVVDHHLSRLLWLYSLLWMPLLVLLLVMRMSNGSNSGDADWAGGSARCGSRQPSAGGASWPDMVYGGGGSTVGAAPCGRGSVLEGSSGGGDDDVGRPLQPGAPTDQRGCAGSAPRRSGAASVAKGGWSVAAPDAA